MSYVWQGIEHADPHWARCPFFASQGVGPIEAETSITPSFLNEATFGTVTRIHTLIRMAHWVSVTLVICRPLSDPVFVTCHDAGWVVRKDGKSQAGFILSTAHGRTCHFDWGTLTNLPD